MVFPSLGHHGCFWGCCSAHGGCHFGDGDQPVRGTGLGGRERSIRPVEQQWCGPTALVTLGARRRRRALGLATAAGGVLLDRALGPSVSAVWFAPVYYTKLSAGHEAGAAVLLIDSFGT